ncbi:DUF433 domain-containing protein [Candidatus Woesearchaeota archaeon]|nr:DUF433 domain-containing protein [Candidatus Woesearchaeota archaeon]
MRVEINDYLVADSEICHGKPTFRGTRVLVSDILELVAVGEPMEEILENYPSITRKHVAAAIKYAAKLLGGGSYVKFSKVSAG